MPSGKAHGIDREYQVTCRDVLIHSRPGLTPWSGDGIDVAIVLPDTTWTFDVALKAEDQSVVIAECRRTISPVKQEDVAAFALKTESLRRTLDRPVFACFFTKTHHQLGAVRVGQFYGVEIAVLAEDAEPPGFNIVFHAYDRDREARIRHFVIHVPTAQVVLTGYAPKITVGNASTPSVDEGSNDA